MLDLALQRYLIDLFYIVYCLKEYFTHTDIIITVKSCKICRRPLLGAWYIWPLSREGSFRVIPADTGPRCRRVSYTGLAFLAALQARGTEDLFLP